MALTRLRMNSPKTPKLDKNKINEEKEKRLKTLREQFLKKNKELTKDNVKKDNNEVNLQNNKTNNNNDKKYKEKIKSLENKISQLKEKESISKNKIRKLENKNSLLMSENESIKSEYDNMSKELNSKNNKVEELSIEISELKEELESYNIKAMKIIARDNLVLKRHSKNKSQEIIRLRNRLRQLKKLNNISLDNIHKLMYGEDCPITRQDMKSINSIINSERLEKQKALDYADRIEKEYKNKYEGIIRENIKLRDRISRIEKLNSNKYQHKKNSYYGNILIKNSFIFFKSVSGLIFPANIDKINKCYDGLVCRAIKKKDDNFVYIKDIYEETSIEEAREKHKAKVKKETDSKLIQDLKLNVDYEQKYNILIIGSRFKNEYLKAIKSMNLNCDWFDSYESNIVKLKRIENRYDIIICCSSHSRHYTTEFIKYMIKKYPEKVNKYNIVLGDSTKTIVGRVRYCIENIDNN